jgi:iron(III) transport system permease protein
MSVAFERPFDTHRFGLWREALVARGGLVLLALALLVFLTVPLATLLVRSLEDRGGALVGLANFATYFASPAFERSATNTLVFAGLTTLITVPFAFGFAYAIQRSCIPARNL